ncbi:MAG: hypothetical protein EAZ99_19345 [Alphaproteobacteria bacterium]|nr:MAG: hypothetical protein EAZ99_19345 [Alphaproteobacteria bacterium]
MAASPNPSLCSRSQGRWSRSRAPAVAVWHSLTPGKQRGLAHLVGSAKREKTRRKRADKLMADLRARIV